MRTVQVETQSTGSFNFTTKEVTQGVKFLSKPCKSCLKSKYEVFPEWSYKILLKNSSGTLFSMRYQMFHAPCFNHQNTPFLFELLSYLCPIVQIVGNYFKKCEILSQGDILFVIIHVSEIDKAFSSDPIFHISENSCQLLVQLDIDISIWYNASLF